MNDRDVLRNQRQSTDTTRPGTPGELVPAMPSGARRRARVALSGSEREPGLIGGLDLAACERARLSRDPRFDGRFFIGVRTTGIYCRPVCPVKPPYARNVVYYATAAAAAEAGFRPCLRCRPEQSAGTPDWFGGSAIVGRALRLIASGVVEDESGVARIAERLGVSRRHLQRLFQQHLGAAPLAVLRTRRVHNAKRLLDETTLRMADIAFAAGFGSVRRFNATFRELYGRTPRELRGARGGGARDGRVRDGGAVTDGFRFRLAYRPPLDWQRHLAYLVPRAIPGVEEAAHGVYRRTFRAGGQVGVLEVREAGSTTRATADGRGRDRRSARSSTDRGGRARGDDARDRAARAGDLVAPGTALELRTTAVEPAHLPAILERARRVFDLGADPDTIRRHLARDPDLRPWLDRCSALRVPGAWDGFELAIRAVIGQQISVAAATTIAGRLARRWGEPLGDRGQVVFPRPETLADADLASIGVPRARGETLRLLARAVANGDVVLEPGTDPDAVRQGLLAIPGIGEWTAQYVALRALGEPDAFPASDLGLLRSPANGGARTPRELYARAERWRPWRGYAAIVLWSAYGAAATEARAGIAEIGAVGAARPIEAEPRPRSSAGRRIERAPDEP